MRIAVACGVSSRGFLPTMITAFRSGGHEVQEFTVANKFLALKEIRDWAPDLLVYEWCTEAAAWFSRNWHGPMAIRLHRFEVFTPHPATVNWANVRRLIVGSPHIAELAWKIAPQMRERTSIVPSAPDTEMFQLQDHGHGLRIGVLANAIPRKNPWAWLQVLGAPRMPDMELVVCGDFPDNEIVEWWNAAVTDKSVAGRVTRMPAIPHEKTPLFWDGVDYALVASLHETAGPRALVEAMLCGVKPVCYAYPGAEQCLPEWALWRTLDEAVDMVLHGEHEPAKYRQWVLDTMGPQVFRPAMLKVAEEAME